MRSFETSTRRLTKRSRIWANRLGSMLLLTAVIALPKATAAQIEGIPVYFNPKGGSGITLAGDYGRGINNDTQKENAFGARAILGVSALSVGAGIGRLDGVTQYSGMAAFRLFGGALVPVAVSVQAGLGYRATGSGVSETKIYDVPIGIGFGLNIPTPGFLLEPWVAPRFALNRVEVGGETQNQTGLGVSGGIRLGFAMGLALHAAFDVADLKAKDFTSFTLPASQPVTLGVGMSYTFRLPGVGVPGM